MMPGIEIEQAEYDAADTKSLQTDDQISVLWGHEFEEGYAGALEGVRAAEENHGW